MNVSRMFCTTPRGPGISQRDVPNDCWAAADVVDMVRIAGELANARKIARRRTDGPAAGSRASSTLMAYRRNRRIELDRPTRPLATLRRRAKAL